MPGEIISVNDYGWRSAGPTYHFGYVTPIILEQVRALGISRVLDLGSGNGRLCGLLKKKCDLVVGVEYDKQGSEIASHTYPDIRFYNMGVQDDPHLIEERYKRGFDAVISTEVIEHLYFPGLLPRFAATLLRPGGYLIVSTPYHGYLKNLGLSVLNEWDRHHTSLRNGGHVKFFSRRTLETLLTEEGFEIVSFIGAGRLPWLWKSMIIVARLASKPSTC